MTSPLNDIQSSVALENFVGKLPPCQKTTNYDSFDVVPVESMMHPMLAVPSFGSTADELYVTATSYEQWGQYFENEIRRIQCEEERQHNRLLEKTNKNKEKRRKARVQANKRKSKFTL